VVGVGEISLEGRWFYGIDRQHAQQYRMTGERFLVRSNNAATGFGDCFCSLGRSSCRLLESAFRWAEAPSCQAWLCAAAAGPVHA